MPAKLFATMFVTVFVAELGDKTQLATLMFAAGKDNSKLLVFAACAAALVLSSAVAVLAGTLVSQYVSPKVLSWAAGVGFIGIGVWTIAHAARA